MKKTFQLAMAGLLLITFNFNLATTYAQSTAFSYQGRLNNASGPATGTFDLTFTLFNTNAGGTLISGPVTNSTVGVSNGLFTVAVDFGSAPFTLGQRLWLEIGARTNGAAAFSTLAPRLEVLSTPIATYAESVNASSLIGQVTDANLSSTFTSPHSFNNAGNSFTGNGSGLTALNASQITSGTVADARLSSNVALRAGGNNFTGNQVVNAGGAGVKVAGTAAPSTYFGSLISDGGAGDFWFLSAYNASGSKRNTIYGAGGLTPLVFQEQGGNVGIGTNTPTATLEVNGNAKIDGTVTATSYTGNGSGLTSLSAAQLTGTIASANLPNGLGGSGNTASGLNATVSGGNGNQVDASSSYSTIGAGNANSISGTLYATIGGGNQNAMNNTAGFGTIGGGNGNFIANTLDGTIAGGFHNAITNGATFAAVGGGNGNVIGGGFDSVIGGGFQNFVNASFATVPGGANNSATANYSFAAGDQAQAVNAGAFVWADSQGVNFSSTNNNSFNVRAQGGARFVTSGAGLTVDGPVTASALRSPGAGVNTGTFAFTQRAVSTNTSGNITVIYNPLTDGDPNAILIVTHNWTADTNSTSKYNTTPVGVYFDGAHWTIFNEDTTSMALGRAFNVMVIKN